MSEIEETREELERLAKIFEDDKLVDTDRNIRELSDSVPAKKDKLSEIYLMILESFRREYATAKPSKIVLFNHIVDIVVSAFLSQKGKLKQKFLELSSLFEAIKNTSLNTSAIAKVFLGTQDLRERYIGSCLIYLLEVEGEYDDTIRLLYVLKMAEQGQDVALDEVHSMQLWRLRQELIRLGVTEELFDGWEDNHLRNAIAHAHFEYDEDTQEMTFTDLHPTTGQQTYRRILDLSEFSQLIMAIQEVSFLFTRLMMLLRIRDLTLACLE